MTDAPENNSHDTKSEVERIVYFADRIALKKRLRYWKSMTFVVLIAAIFIIFRQDVLTGLGGANISGHVARIRIDGFIAENRYRNEFLDELAETDAVKAVLIHIDSPGGTLIGGEDLYAHIKKISAKKPVVAIAGNMAASGAYMAAIAADRIFVRHGSIVGSVGVIFQTLNVAELSDKTGIKMMSYASGKLKAQPSPFEEPSDAAVRVMKGLVDDVQDMFLDMVTDERDIKPEHIPLVADGRIFSGTQGIAIGLVDALGDEEDAVAWLEKEKGLEKDLRIIDKKSKNRRQNIIDRIKDKTAQALFGRSETSPGMYALSVF